MTGNSAIEHQSASQSVNPGRDARDALASASQAQWQQHNPAPRTTTTGQLKRAGTSGTLGYLKASVPEQANQQSQWSGQRWLQAGDPSVTQSGQQLREQS